MIDRRLFMLGAAALAGRTAQAVPPPPRFSLTGRREQGSLVVGKSDVPCEVFLDGDKLHVSDDGRFAFGIPFDRSEQMHLSMHYPDGSIANNVVTPGQRTYKEQRIDGLPENKVSPPPEIVERIRRENAMVAELRNVDSDLVAFAEPFDWPVAGIVSGVFGSRRILNGEPRAPHFGIDIAAAEGTPIKAPVDGVVALAEPDFYLTGGTTLLDHGHGVFSVYIHQSALKVAKGERIVRGQIIGLVGKTGRATGPHLHWGLNWFQVRLDPSCSTKTPIPPRA